MKHVWGYYLVQCWEFCLQGCVGAVPKNTKKAKKAGNAKKAAGKVPREEGVDVFGVGALRAKRGLLIK